MEMNCTKELFESPSVYSKESSFHRIGQGRKCTRVILSSDRTKAHQVLFAKISCKNVIFPWVETCGGPIDHIDVNGSTSSDILMQPRMRDEIATVAQQCLIYLTCWASPQQFNLVNLFGIAATNINLNGAFRILILFVWHRHNKH